MSDSVSKYHERSNAPKKGLVEHHIGVPPEAIGKEEPPRLRLITNHLLDQSSQYEEIIKKIEQKVSEISFVDFSSLNLKDNPDDLPSPSLEDNLVEINGKITYANSRLMAVLRHLQSII